MKYNKNYRLKDSHFPLKLLNAFKGLNLFPMLGICIDLKNRDYFQKYLQFADKKQYLKNRIHFQMNLKFNILYNVNILS